MMRIGSIPLLLLVPAVSMTGSGCDAHSKSAGTIVETEGEGEEEATSSDGSSGASSDSTSDTATSSSSSTAGTDGAGGACAPISADDYDRTCTANADCVAVFEGEADHGCRECAFSAINIADYPAYLEDAPPTSCSSGECAADCVAGDGDPGYCVSEQCELSPLAGFTCGEMYCRPDQEICVLLISDVGGEPNIYQCETLPPSCQGSDDCDCLTMAANEFEHGFCAAEGSCQHDGAGFHVSCPGG